MISASILVWLRSFEAAARHSNFTRAAAELCVSQGAVSQQVKHLERSLHRTLFHRGARQLTLTADGTQLQSVVRDAFRNIDAELTLLRRAEDLQSIALSCAPSFAMGWLTPRLGDFFREQPAIDLKVLGGFHVLDRSRLVRDGIDAAVRFDLGHYGDLSARRFLGEWLLPVASPSFIANHPEVRAPAGLRPEWLLHDTEPWETADEFEEWGFWLEQAGIDLSDLHLGRRFNLSQLALAAALSGQGVAMGRAALVLEDLAAGRLIDLYRLCVPSIAAYFFVAPHGAAGAVGKVEAWLRSQAQQFDTARAHFIPNDR
jgi:LysR family glycine cleavage system transcriptional activator